MLERGNGRDPWIVIQNKQPDFPDDSNSFIGPEQGRGMVRKGWEVLQSDYEDVAPGTGVVVYKLPRHGHIRVEVWDEYILRRAFSPLYDLEAYCVICDQRNWIPESII